VCCPAHHLFLQIEKVLQQGDISDAAEPYLKARDIDKKTLEKSELNAQFFCQQLGQYRMPFAWTAISVLDILAGNQATGASSTPAVSSPDPRQGHPRDKEGTPEPGRRRDTRTGSVSSQTGRSTLEDSYSAEQKETKKGFDILLSQNFRPVTLTVNVFFKQVGVVCGCGL